MQIKEYVGKSLLFAISANYDSVWRDFSARLRKEHCNFIEAMILIALFFESQNSNSDDAEGLRPAALAEAFGTTRANLSHGVTRLEKEGLLKRTLVDGDARGYKLVLKPEGRRVALRLISTVDELEGYFEKHLGAREVERTITHLSKVSSVYREFVNYSAGHK